jgi:hypothetical protein
MACTGSGLADSPPGGCCSRCWHGRHSPCGGPHDFRACESGRLSILGRASRSLRCLRLPCCCTSYARAMRPACWPGISGITPAFFCWAWLSVSLRVSLAHRKDNYRSAAEAAQNYAGKGLRVWRAADPVAADYYGIRSSGDPAMRSGILRIDPVWSVLAATCERRRIRAGMKPRCAPAHRISA